MPNSAILDEHLLLLTAGDDPAGLRATFRDIRLVHTFLHDDAQAALLTCAGGHGWADDAEGNTIQLARVEQIEVATNTTDINPDRWDHDSRQLRDWHQNHTPLTLLLTQRASYLTDGTASVVLPQPGPN